MRSPWAIVLALALGVVLGLAPRAEAAGHVNVAVIQGSINPASSDYLRRAIEQSEEEGAALLLIELDTPGGLVASTKDIIQAMLNSRVPIAVFVAPQGAWAGSAGTFITLAGHVAAMAPGSSIGAAHPVGLGGGGQQQPEGEEGAARPAAEAKAENLLASFIEAIAAERDRNVEWAERAVRESIAATADEALELDVIDLVARDRSDLLAQIDGREIEIGGEKRTLAVAGVERRTIEMSAMTRLLNVLVDPNVAVLLLMAGALGLYIEFNQPGMLVPGILGAACLLMAMIAMQILPFSWFGLLLILFGLGLFVAEVFVTSYGILLGLGLVCLLAGGSMIFDRPELSDLNVSFWPVLVPAVAGMGIFAVIVVVAVGRTMGKAETAGLEELVGMKGSTAERMEGQSMIFLRGEYWTAITEEPVEAGGKFEVTAVEGLRLYVRPARGGMS